MRHWLLCGLLSLMCAGLAQAAQPVDFTMADLDGRVHKLSDYRGKWVVVNYWATWCPPCLEEIPELEIFHNNNAAGKAVVLGVNMENIGLSELAAFVDEQFISYPILHTKPSRRSPLGSIRGLPTSFIVSPQGHVVGKRTGTVTLEMLNSLLEQHEAAPAGQQSSVETARGGS